MKPTHVQIVQKDETCRHLPKIKGADVYRLA